MYFVGFNECLDAESSSGQEQVTKILAVKMCRILTPPGGSGVLHLGEPRCLVG